MKGFASISITVPWINFRGCDWYTKPGDCAADLNADDEDFTAALCCACGGGSDGSTEPECGNEVIEAGEDCDDGNRMTTMVAQQIAPSKVGAPVAVEIPTRATNGRVRRRQYSNGDGCS